ncbi:MAG TPA: LamG domain-containing protein [bacterium]|nr:LamG domain-containing protein [bacterium]
MRRARIRVLLFAAALAGAACGRDLFNHGNGFAGAGWPTPVDFPGASATPTASGSPTPKPFCDPADLTLVLCLQFDGSLADGSSYHHAASSTAGISYATGVHGQALHAGATTVFAIADSPSLDLTTALTFEVWVKPDSLPGTAGARMGLLDNDSQYGFFINNPSGDFDPSVGVVVADASATEVGTWTHLAATWTQASNTLQTYVNGVPKASGSFNGTLTQGNANGSVVAGNSPNGDNLLGSLDDLRLFRRALTPQEICSDGGGC